MVRVYPTFVPHCTPCTPCTPLWGTAIRGSASRSQGGGPIWWMGRGLNDDVTSVPTVLLLIPLFTTLTKCEAFRYIRADLLSKVEETLNNRNIRYIEGKPLFELLFEQEAVAQLVAKYLTTAMEIRDFLIENHRQST